MSARIDVPNRFGPPAPARPELPRKKLRPAGTLARAGGHSNQTPSVARSTDTPGPIVDEIATFCRYTPFDAAGFIF